MSEHDAAAYAEVQPVIGPHRRPDDRRCGTGGADMTEAGPALTPVGSTVSGEPRG